MTINTNIHITKMSNKKPPNRKAHDDAAYRAIATAVERDGRFSYNTDSPAQAIAMRFNFYNWRNTLRRSGETVFPGHNLVVRLNGSEVIFEVNTVNERLRAALAHINIPIDESPEEVSLEEITLDDLEKF